VAGGWQSGWGTGPGEAGVRQRAGARALPAASFLPSLACAPAERTIEPIAYQLLVPDQGEGVKAIQRQATRVSALLPAGQPAAAARAACTWVMHHGAQPVPVLLSQRNYRDAHMGRLGTWHGVDSVHSMYARCLLRHGASAGGWLLITAFHAARVEASVSQALEQEHAFFCRAARCIHLVNTARQLKDAPTACIQQLQRAADPAHPTIHAYQHTCSSTQ